jgi:bla regulator protein BlaR1
MTHELLNHLWQSTVFAVAVGLLTLLFRSNGAHTRYWLWFAASCKFLIPFSLLSDLGTHLSWRSAPATMPLALGDFARPFSMSTAAVGALPAGVPLAPIGAVHGVGVNWLLVVLGVWACGTIAIGARWMRRWLRLRAEVRKASPVELNVAIPARSSATPIEPGVVGLFRPVLLLPEGICERLTPSQMKTILAHEMCHVRRRDNLTAAMHMLVEAVFWFHPLVWWIGRQMIVEREAACDEAVLAQSGDREGYAEALLTVCKFYVESPLASAAGVAGADLKKRIEWIMTPRITHKLNLAKKMLLAAAATATVLAPIAIASLFAIPTGTLAQTQGAHGATFQSVTIRADEPSLLNVMIGVGPGRFNARGYTLRELIAWGYDVQGSLISGPAALDAKYSVDATAPGAFTEANYTAIDAARAMVRTMLEEQFQLQVHHRAQSVSVYVLSAGGANVLMKAASPTEPGPGIALGPTSIGGGALRMDDFVEALSQRLGHPILDQTGLKQTYDFNLDWKVNATPPAAGNPGGPSPDVLASALQSQLGLSLQPATAPAEMLIVDHVALPKSLAPARTAVPMDPVEFDAYAGHYLFMEGMVVNVFRDGGHLFTQPPGQTPIEIFPEAQDKFFAKIVDAEVSFERDATGKVTGLALHQAGRDIEMARLDEVTAKQMIDAQNAKMQQKTATPGSEDALRRDLTELASGKPDYDRMSPELAAVTKEELTVLQREFQALGTLNALKFTGVDPQGADIYAAEFEHGSIECHIALMPDGKIANVSLRPMP